MSPRRLRRSQSESAAFRSTETRGLTSISGSTKARLSPNSRFGALSPATRIRPRSGTSRSNGKASTRGTSKSYGFWSESVVKSESDDVREEDEYAFQPEEDDEDLRFTVEDETHLYAFCAHVAVFIENEADRKRQRTMEQSESLR